MIDNKIRLEGSKLICVNCGKGSIKNTDRYNSFKCECGIMIYYPATNVFLELKNGNK